MMLDGVEATKCTPHNMQELLFIISGLYGYHSDKIHIHWDYYHFQQLMELLFSVWF